MVFSSSIFIYFFIPIFFTLYYVSPRKARNALILLASLLFYTAGAGLVVLALLLSIWGNHFLALRLMRPDMPHRRALLLGGVGLNLAGIVYYKYIAFLWVYADMGTGLFGLSLGPAPQVMLPIGISFFTFQAISYLIDVYRNDAPPAKSYFHFAVYHTLFPQLVAGPIVRFREIGHELYERSARLPDVAQGAYRFCLGLGKKMILADHLGLVTDQILQLPAGELTAPHAWLAMVCYTLQIYFDFSGYSDMAIGLGRMLGFSFPENFNQPYRSTSVTEFWRRWHMTLTRWFRDYLYIPMGGNRQGRMRTYINLWVVFALCGLWHGASINFLLWGIYHGFWLVAERIADKRFGLRPRGALGFMFTLLVVMIGWMFFRIEQPGAALYFIQVLFGFGNATTIYYPVSYYLANDTLFYLAAALACAFIPYRQACVTLSSRPGILALQLGAATLVFAFSMLLLAANSFNPFIYFRF